MSHKFKKKNAILIFLKKHDNNIVSHFNTKRSFVVEQFMMYLVLSTLTFAGPFQISSPEHVDLLWSTPLDDPLTAASVNFFFA